MKAYTCLVLLVCLSCVFGAALRKKRDVNEQLLELRELLDVYLMERESNGSPESRFFGEDKSGEDEYLAKRKPRSCSRNNPCPSGFHCAMRSGRTGVCLAY